MKKENANNQTHRKIRPTLPIVLISVYLLDKEKSDKVYTYLIHKELNLNNKQVQRTLRNFEQKGIVSTTTIKENERQRILFKCTPKGKIALKNLLEFTLEADLLNDIPKYSISYEKLRSKIKKTYDIVSTERQNS